MKYSQKLSFDTPEEKGLKRYYRFRSETKRSEKNMALKTTLEDDVRFALGKLDWDTERSNVFDLLNYTVNITRKDADADSIPIGTSKIGGQPDVPTPETFEWPECKGQPMTFVTQINFEELHPFDRDGVFPDKGMLYFFFYVDSEDFRYPERRDEYETVFLPEADDVSKLQPMPFPESLPKAVHLVPCDLHFASDFTLPAFPNFKFKGKGFSPDDIARLGEADALICGVTGRTPTDEYWMLGEPQTLESDVYKDWSEHALNGSEPEDYMLLQQISFTDSSTNLFMFGNLGIAYWGITKEDLAEKRFENTVLICQTP